MKQHVLKSLPLVLASLFVFSSCQKDDGQSFKDQLTGHWQSTQITIDGVSLGAYTSYDLMLESSREFDLVTTSGIGAATSTHNSKGDWQENDEKRDVTFTFNETNQVIVYDVLDLTEDVLSVEYTQDGSRIRILFNRTN